ncbi:Gfo/Idh/MocA family oxidoreductase [Solibacillus sp. MA9]|uniref:Gfo/Idh/MocA family oxidoreductase n=1 Tax=Solibacillus palustris TaxID=2908203 RepID=A0ABS9UGD0_9BACL|nr:Gfo/Idh/MocA family oxidoreductase [Solibacillus sp. MA9]MCH7323402.1 Gfo/Idh/MocA family oxidoreductase [Solibacillus sp. MA9]
MSKLKVAVIGTGSISDLHLGSYEKNANAELFGVYDVSLERAKDKAQQFGATKVYESLDELFSDEALQAVSICTWNNTHAPLAIRALESGLHVLVEKPLAMTYAESLEIQAAAQKAQKVFQVGYVRRFATNTKVLKQFVDAGRLGEIYYAKATCNRRLGNPGGWFADVEKSGGGPLIDLGVHIIDICWYLMGKPKVAKVSGNTYKNLGNRSNVKNLSFYKTADYDASKNSVEDLANAIITFENGASLMVDVSYTLHATQNELSVKLFGTKGGAELEPELKIVAEEFDTILNVHPQIDYLTFDFNAAFQSEIDSFVNAILENKPSEAPVEDGVEIMKILEGIYTSAQTGREVYYEFETSK